MANNSRDLKLEQQIDAYIKGQLSDEEAEQLWVQLMQQPDYIKLLHTEIDVARIYKSKSNAGHSYWRWAAAAAAIILLAVALSLFMPGEPKPLKTWGESQINIAENMASAEVTRSASAPLEPADSLLNLGYKTAVSGELDKAMEIFRGIVSDYQDAPAVSQAYLNLGILQFNSGEYDNSISSFTSAISNASDNALLVERSYWYLGNAFVNTERFEEARNAVEEAYKRGKIYKKESYKLLKRLEQELGINN